jgi:transcriptional regulator with XRE-family HTH domain
VPQPEEIAAALPRGLRRARQLSLDALAGLARVSRGMLLQIKGQRVNPSLATLVRIADALDVSVSALVDLGAGASVRLVRATDAVNLWRGEHGGFGRLLVRSDRLDHLETWTWTFEPGRPMVPKRTPRHAGNALCHCRSADARWRRGAIPGQDRRRGGSVQGSAGPRLLRPGSGHAKHLLQLDGTIG